MKLHVMVTFLIAIALAFTSEAVAKPYKSNAGKVEVVIPDSWKSVATSDVLLTTTDPKREVAFIFMVTASSERDAAIKSLDKMLDQRVKGSKWGARKDIALNGLRGTLTEGTAEIAGQAAEISLMILKTPSNMELIVFGAIDLKKKDDHAAALLDIMKSLKPSN